MARQPTSIETLKVYASDTLAAHEYLMQTVKMMETSQVNTLMLHASMVESVYLPAVVAFAIDCASQAGIEAIAKRAGSVSYTARVVEKVVKRKQRAAEKREQAARQAAASMEESGPPAPPAAAPAPAPVKKPRKRG